MTIFTNSQIQNDMYNIFTPLLGLQPSYIRSGRQETQTPTSGYANVLVLSKEPLVVNPSIDFIDSSTISVSMLYRVTISVDFYFNNADLLTTKLLLLISAMGSSSASFQTTSPTFQSLGYGVLSVVQVENNRYIGNKSDRTEYVDRSTLILELNKNMSILISQGVFTGDGGYGINLQSNQR